MRRDDCVAMVKLVLGFRQDQDQNVVTAMVAAQEQLELGPIKPWFLISEDARAYSSPGDPRLAVPDDFLEELEEGALYYEPESGGEVELLKGDYDRLQRYYKKAEGEPEAYALVGNYFVLFPTPDQAYAIRMRYVKRDESLSANVENGWLKWFPYLIMGEAGMTLAASLRDKDAYQQFRDWKTAGMILMQSQTTARETANRSYQMGGPH